jgi:hypothetical protein
MMMTGDKPESRTSAVAALDEKAGWRAAIHPGKRHGKLKGMQGCLSCDAVIDPDEQYLHCLF